MKVICTEQPPNKAWVNGRQVDVPYNCMVHVGSEYEVINTRAGHGNIELYILSGKPKNWGYNPKYFSQISDLDETVLVNTKEECV